MEHTYIISSRGQLKGCQCSDVGFINVLDNVVIHIGRIDGLLHISISVIVFQIPEQREI